MKLYHFPHCPFCQRVRFFLGFKQIPYESIEIPYNDEDARIKLSGQTALPIIEFDNGDVMTESADMIREIEYRFPHPIGFIGPVEGLFQWAQMVAVGIPDYFTLLLPFCHDHYAEFTDYPAVADFFREAKEAKRGETFAQIQSTAIERFDKQIKPHLEPIIEKLEGGDFCMGPTFSVADCILAADLSGLRLIPGIDLDRVLVEYIDRVEKNAKYDYLSIDMKGRK